jgi:hypothetical protein
LKMKRLSAPSSEYTCVREGGPMIAALGGIGIVGIVVLIVVVVAILYFVRR